MVFKVFYSQGAHDEIEILDERKNPLQHKLMKMTEMLIMRMVDTVS